MFEKLYFVGLRERQFIMYSLDLRASCCTYLAVFMAHEGSLNYTLNYLVMS